MPAVYESFAPFYDLEYGLKDDDLSFYLALAATYGDQILEIGTGTGRISLELARRGYKVWGIDDSVRMLRLVKKKLEKEPEKTRRNSHFYLADMRNFNLNTRFNLCIIPFRTFLHNLTMKHQLATLNCIHRHLVDNGVLAFDLFVPVHQVLGQSQWRLHIPAEELAASKQDVSITANIQHDPAKQLLKIKNIYHRSGKPEVQATMKYRYIFRYEMELLLLSSGFDLLQCTGGFAGEPYNFHSGIMCFISRKVTLPQRSILE